MIIRQFAAAAALFAALIGQASAQTCSLAQMASLDMTVLPDGRVTVPVSINGQTFPFLVDTAGVFSEISEGAAQKLNLKETDAGVEMYGVGGKLRVTSAMVASFKVGNNEAKNFHIGVRHSAAIGRQAGKLRRQAGSFKRNV